MQQQHELKINHYEAENKELKAIVQDLKLQFREAEINGQMLDRLKKDMEEKGKEGLKSMTRFQLINRILDLQK